MRVLWDASRVLEFSKVVNVAMEGYSKRESVELECDDGGDCFGECSQWSAVVGVEDAPGLEVGDRAFDLVAD